jgi:phenylacetate-coenzyme A ligase PaaK-like adenylate-forming protein
MVPMAPATAPALDAATPHGHALDPVRGALAYWTWYARTLGIWHTRRGGMAAVAAAARTRLRELTAFARERSALYRDLYHGLPLHRIRAADLPPVTRAELMARFDEWVTDPDVTRTGVEAFMADPAQVGERYLDRYLVWKSSGSSGVPGIYVQDEDALAAYDALIAAQLDIAGLVARYGWAFYARGGRAALVAATGDHFASIASWRRLTRAGPWLAARSFSVLAPLPELVADLNAYQPGFVASYPTVLLLLADEQAAGRLRIAPAGLWSGGECLVPAARAAIEHAFGCPLVDEYGSSECMSIGFGCGEGWLHVNADWVLLEPVDRHYRPTEPGVPSHTVLLTNLANRVQPVIRYDLGDSVVVKAEPCRCGNPLPAIRVEGRRDDVVALRAGDGSVVHLPPLALTTVVEESARVHRFQIVQDAPDRLLLRLDGGECREPAVRDAAWRAANRALRAFLAQQALPDVAVVLDDHAPIADPRSGKLRQVIVVVGHAARRHRHPDK